MKKFLLILLSAVSLLPSCKNEASDVEVLAEKIVLSKTEMHLDVDNATVLKATIEPKNTTVQRIVWSVKESSVSNCLTVNKDGVVVAHNNGTAIVVASAIDGSNVADSCFVTVGAPDKVKTYAVGDAYPNDEEPIGVVFTVDEEGKSGKIISLDSSRDEVKWGDDTFTVECHSDNDGLFNTNLVKEIDEDFSDYPAFKWVHEIKNGGSASYKTGTKNVWYIPSQKELRQLFAAMCSLKWLDDGNYTLTDTTVSDWGTDMAMPYYYMFESSVAIFNENLVKLGGEEIAHNWHWSSSEVVDYFAWYVDLYCGYTYHFHKGSPAIVRPIMQF